MRGVKRTTPLQILCKRPGCEGIRVVRRPYEQRRGGYCSRRCAALATRNILRADHAAAGRASAAVRRQRVLEKVTGLMPLVAFRLGYMRGLQSKLRQIRKRYTLVKKR